jgi:hypothetical protein
MRLSDSDSTGRSPRSECRPPSFSGRPAGRPPFIRRKRACSWTGVAANCPAPALACMLPCALARCAAAISAAGWRVIVRVGWKNFLCRTYTVLLSLCQLIKENADNPHIFVLGYNPYGSRRFYERAWSNAHHEDNSVALIAHHKLSIAVFFCNLHSRISALTLCV